MKKPKKHVTNPTSYRFELIIQHGNDERWDQIAEMSTPRERLKAVHEDVLDAFETSGILREYVTLRAPKDV